MDELIESISDNPKEKKGKRFPWYLFVISLVLWVGSTVLVYYYASATREYNYTFFLSRGDTRAPLSYGPNSNFADPTFFARVREEMIQNKITFIEIDLSRMELKFYEEGVVKKEAPVLAKGRIGSWWETPPGLYRAESKKRNPRSSYGPVTMPWSIPFYGNFFIHGWPYLLDGTPAKSRYSAGCIRLSVDDAKEVYSLTNIGTPILIFEDRFTSSSDISFSPIAPKVSVTGGLIADAASNYVFWQKNKRQVFPMGDAVHWLTAVVASERYGIERRIRTSAAAVAQEGGERFTPGASYTVFSLLFPLLMESSDAAAATLASLMGEEVFINLLNEKARALGMENTHIQSIRADDEGNVTTPQDLFYLMKYVVFYRRFVLEVHGGRVAKNSFGPFPFGAMLPLTRFDSMSEEGRGFFALHPEKNAILGAKRVVFDGGASSTIIFIGLGSQDRFNDSTAFSAYKERLQTVFEASVRTDERGELQL